MAAFARSCGETRHEGHPRHIQAFRCDRAAGCGLWRYLGLYGGPGRRSGDLENLERQLHVHHLS
jgi:hypothetical protein